MGRGRRAAVVSGLDPRLRPDSRLTSAEIEQYESSGLWRRRSLRSLLSDSAEVHPQRVAAVGYRLGRLDPASVLNYAELDELASRLAGGFAGLLLGRGDVIAVMLPNRPEFAALIFAINQVGATYTGIPVTYGRREVLQILGQSAAAAVVVEDSAGLAIVRELRDELPALEHVVVLADSEAALEQAELPYAELLENGLGARADDHTSVCHIGFTSGTTGAPKGVMNTAQTLESIIRHWIEHVGGQQALGDPVVNLIASPVGHHTGYCWGVLLTAYTGGTAVYLDRWRPAVAREVLAEQRVTAMFGAPTFVQDLVQATAAGQSPDDEALCMITVAGAPVPRSLPSVAGDTLGCLICPAWGMTEYAIALSWAPSLGADAQETDGVPVAGSEVRVVTEAGESVAPGEVGELEVRGAGLFIGYHERLEENAKAFTDGWFRTGDTATFTGDGQVLLIGRSKDIVIRGGENIPVVELESLLFDHPKVRDVAVIGVPDARLGQRACAVVVACGEPPTLEELCRGLLEQGLSKRFLPERLEVVPELPKTASGKIRKIELRERFT
jgi:cyclohexanecarboxylate-CoA ligase